MSVNPFEGKVLIYSLKGVCLKYVNYNKTITSKYGNPISVSHNGMNMLFNKNGKLKYTIVTFHAHGPEVIVTFNLVDALKNSV